MAEKRQLEFFLLRYVPDAVKEEFVNIGVAAVEVDGGFAEVRFSRDWSRVQCFDPQADLEVLQALEGEIRQGLRGDRPALMKMVEESFSGLVQASGWRGCYTEDPAKEMELLARIYLQSTLPAARPSRQPSERHRIRSAMEEAFKATNVWRLLHKDFDLAPYTWADDPMKIDFGYRVGEVMKMFHGLPLKSSREDAWGLQVRYPKLQAGMRPMKVNKVELTAVIEDNAPRDEAEVGFVLGVMKETGILVAAVSEMPEIAERARVELEA